MFVESVNSVLQSVCLSVYKVSSQPCIVVSGLLIGHLNSYSGFLNGVKTASIYLQHRLYRIPGIGMQF